MLIVDDEVPFATVLRKALNHEGWGADIVHDGTAGLAAARGGNYDAIVLDLMLPGMNGYRVIESLRQTDSETPILMLTAKDGDVEQADALDLGADAYLTKPVSLVVLTATLRALMRRSAEASEQDVAIRDLTLSMDRRCAMRGDVAIPLTPREFELLRYLMLNAGRIMSKTQIIESVWDEYYDGPHNVVEVYIGYLRRKIDQPFGTNSIRTARGFGYYFEGPT